MSSYTKRYVEVGDIKFACYDEGPRQNQAIVLLHGMPTSCYLWRKVIKELSNTWRCIAPDLVGMGDTVCSSDERFDLAAQATAIANLCRKLELRRILVVGHDIGGGVAQYLALRHESLVSGLALVDSACYDNWPVGVIRTLRGAASMGRGFGAFFRLGLAKKLAYSQRGFRRGVKHPGSLGPNQIDEYIRPYQLSATGRQRLQNMVRSLSNVQTREIANEFYRFTKPVLVVWALDDAFFPLIWAERLATDFPNSDLRTISDCGHFVPEERPRQLAIHIDRLAKSILNSSDASTTTTEGYEP
ncbi:MAG: alpha/beta hydrolase [Deltaproteobacteria bacterium]|nr:alpha/beta hydrolase [Deltaproteobacteria bacterium]